MAVYRLHKHCGKHGEYPVKELVELLPDCSRDDFTDFKNKKISFTQFKRRTFKLIEMKTGQDLSFVCVDDVLPASERGVEETWFVKKDKINILNQYMEARRAEFGDKYSNIPKWAQDVTLLTKYENIPDTAQCLRALVPAAPRKPSQSAHPFGRTASKPKAVAKDSAPRAEKPPVFRQKSSKSSQKLNVYSASYFKEKEKLVAEQTRSCAFIRRLQKDSDADVILKPEMEQRIAYEEMKEKEWARV